MLKQALQLRWVQAVLGLIVVCAVIGGLANSWIAATAAASAYGTLILALVTWQLVQRTHDLAENAGEDAKRTRELAALAQKEQDERVRPFVVLCESEDWRASGEKRKQGLPFHNAGLGPALNVNVDARWYSSNCAFAPTSLAPGDHAVIPARTLIGTFDEVHVRATYSDLTGRAWETRVRLERSQDGQIQFHLCAYGLSELLTPPSWKAGWDMPDGQPQIRLPVVEVP